MLESQGHLEEVESSKAAKRIARGLGLTPLPSLLPKKLSPCAKHSKAEAGN